MCPLRIRTFLLAVEVDDGGQVMTVLALVTTGAQALGEIEADGFPLAVKAARAHQVILAAAARRAAAQGS